MRALLLATQAESLTTGQTCVQAEAVFEGDPRRAIGFVPLLFYATACVASGLIALFSYRLARRVYEGPSVESTRPLLLDRLPQHMRGQLLHQSRQDHYVEVNTEKGRAFAAHAPGDAIGEAKETEGLQIHLSHWVARNAVKEGFRCDGRVFLRLMDGTELPVSRRYLREVKVAGLV